MISLDDLYRALASWRVAGLAAAVTLIFTLVLFPASARKFRHEGGKHIIHLQLAFTVERFRGILLDWAAAIPESPKWLKQSILKLDYLFPILYATAFASVYAALTSRATPTGMDVFFVTVPFIAGAFDWIENTLHLAALRGVHTREHVEVANLNPAVVFAASCAALCKFVMLTVSVVGWVVGGVQTIA